MAGVCWEPKERFEGKHLHYTVMSNVRDPSLQRVFVRHISIGMCGRTNMNVAINDALKLEKS